MSSAIGGDVATALHAEEETEVPLPYEVHEYALEHFLLQVLLIVFISKILGLVLLWLKQPEVFGEILAGILIGVSGLGRIPGFNEYVFPEDSLIPLSIIAEIALMFTMFLIGEEIEIAGLQKKRVWGVALVGCLAAFGLGIGIAAFLYAWLDETVCVCKCVFVCVYGCSCICAYMYTAHTLLTYYSTHCRGSTSLTC
jgi:Kef-type K+ transport system membrane component KefB